MALCSALPRGSSHSRKNLSTWAGSATWRSSPLSSGRTSSRSDSSTALTTASAYSSKRSTSCSRRATSSWMPQTTSTSAQSAWSRTSAWTTTQIGSPSRGAATSPARRPRPRPSVPARIAQATTGSASPGPRRPRRTSPARLSGSPGRCSQESITASRSTSATLDLTRWSNTTIGASGSGALKATLSTAPYALSSSMHQGRLRARRTRRSSGVGLCTRGP
mmetsp:Transcript_143816/g.358489  ORF Transcript_143816/g.358489 Transcript_143816/m.358489 type:complete len:220 (-) Transcript_143816:10-669(-)